jgi:2-amino-4-hydroxy-6-hydroxymethyldihydropteridine diphosphokinase
MTRVFLALGSNVGNRRENLRMALAYLSRHIRIVAVSSLYRSEAVVVPGDAPGPDFFNAVCEVDTDLPPEALLSFVKAVEYEIGRRPPGRWAPRPIDIDILLYGEHIVDNDSLIIPHPLLHERTFVLVPLSELAPDLVHPRLQIQMSQLADELDFAGLAHIEGPEWAEFSDVSFDTGDNVRWNDA